MKVEKSGDDKVQLIKVIGRVDAYTAPDLEAQLAEASVEGYDLAIDLSEMEFISSAGLRVLLSLAKRARADKFKLCLCGLQPTVQEVFDIAGFTALFEMRASADVALDELRSKKKAVKAMQVRFWGARGSIPTPLSNQDIERKLLASLRAARDAHVDLNDDVALREFVAGLPLPIRGSWGGNTTCVEVRDDAGDIVILDAGSGIRRLGLELMNESFGQGKGVAAILFTHTHWDHIQGLPFFVPMFRPGNRFDIYFPPGDIEERLTAQQESRFFPLPLAGMPAQKNFIKMERETELFDGRIKASWLELDHPGNTYAYRLEADGKAVIMATDGEYRELVGPYWNRCIDFFHGADLMMFDSQYTLREALVEKQSWGHSSAMIGIDLAVDAGVKDIVLVHHEPTYTDEKIQQIYEDTLRYLNRTPAGERPTVQVGYEGLTIKL